MIARANAPFKPMRDRGGSVEQKLRLSCSFRFVQIHNCHSIVKNPFDRIYFISDISVVSYII